ncbi:unnamed protein product [Parascedosporium putredinis]|uniref:ABM domain-containing protein n=1 Tax=Parascedosporium putredinis TaxID=1442378 RepID=A0A9P1MCU3_9PEZI|nr:unnamed protein product [Parascedosporium putredinis]CAI8002280.1 unnamed protein product [Parascedosporium putredinis]
MPTKQVIQLVIVPHRPAVPDEIAKDLAPAFSILQKAPGLQKLWRGKSSRTGTRNEAYAEFHRVLQPAMNGRSITRTAHALLEHSRFSDAEHLEQTLASPAIEIALTKVVEGGVAGYYSQFGKVVSGILDAEEGCDGYFISPLIEEPQDQLLLINWKSVDAHHEEFEKKPGFAACIDALKEYYRVFVVPWHITEIYKVEL